MSESTAEKMTSSAETSSPFWAVVFACMFMTGHCDACGGDRDYVGEFVDAGDGAR